MTSVHDRLGYNIAPGYRDMAEPIDSDPIAAYIDKVATGNEGLREALKEAAVLLNPKAPTTLTIPVIPTNFEASSRTWVGQGEAYVIDPDGDIKHERALPGSAQFGDTRTTDESLRIRFRNGFTPSTLPIIEISYTTPMDMNLEVKRDAYGDVRLTSADSPSELRKAFPQLRSPYMDIVYQHAFRTYNSVGSSAPSLRMSDMQQRVNGLFDVISRLQAGHGQKAARRSS